MLGAGQRFYHSGEQRQTNTISRATYFSKEDID
jgi:hypothetical protein